MSDEAAIQPTPKAPRKRSGGSKRARPSPTPKKDQNAPWVVFWASEDPKLKRVLIGCQRCGCRLSFPNKTPVYRIESALYGFRLDHQDCKAEKEAPKEVPSTAIVPISRPQVGPR